jgi:cell division protein FtsB
MFGFHEKRRIQRLLYSRYFVLFMCLPISLLFLAVWHAYQTEQETGARQAELATELSKLQLRAADLEHNIATLDDPRGVEAGLRERYEVGRQGEEAIVFVEQDPPEKVQTASSTEERGLWERLMAKIF